MKLCVLFACAALSSAVPAAFGATNISYTATAAPGTAGGDGTDSNGMLTTVWSVTHSYSGTTVSGSYGTLLGDSGTNGGGSGAGAGSSAWGLTAYGGADSSATATNDGNEIDIGHTFTGGALNIGQSVSLQFDAAYVNSGNEYGIRLYGASGFVLSLSFVGGGSGSYQYYDASNNGVAAFGYNAGGFTLTYTQTGATTYGAVAKQGTTTLGSFSGTVSGAPTFIQVYDNNAGQGANYNVFANNLSIVPEPSSFGWLGAGLGVALLGLLCRSGQRRA